MMEINHLTPLPEAMTAKEYAALIGFPSPESVTDFRYIQNIMGITSDSPTLSGREVIRRHLVKLRFEAGIDTSHKAAEPKAASIQPSATATDALSHLQQAIALMASSQSAPLDESRVIELIKTHASPMYKGIEVTLPDGSKTKHEGLTHKNFDKLLRMATAGIHIWMHGPAGTAKTSSAMKVAQVLGRSFHYTSCSLTSTKTDFLGFVNAMGVVVETEFRKAFLEGGVFLLDEVDSANANVGVALNAAIDNRIAAFPDGIFTAHENFVCIAAANTAGMGATSSFKGRVAQDEAFMDRFTFLEWPIDEALEMAIAPSPDFTKVVQAVRAVVAELGIQLPVTPRASIQGGKLFLMGLSKKECLESALFKGKVSADVAKQILNRI